MKKSHLLWLFICSMVMSIWMSNTYRDALYAMGKSNFMADSGGNLLVVVATCSMLWYRDLKTIGSYGGDSYFMNALNLLVISFR